MPAAPFGIRWATRIIYKIEIKNTWNSVAVDNPNVILSQIILSYVAILSHVRNYKRIMLTRKSSLCRFNSMQYCRNNAPDTDIRGIYDIGGAPRISTCLHKHNITLEGERTLGENEYLHAWCLRVTGIVLIKFILIRYVSCQCKLRFVIRVYSENGVNSVLECHA